MSVMDRVRRRFLGNEFDKLAEAMSMLNRSYYDGPWRMPPAQLAQELKELDSQLLYDLLQQAGWDVVSAAGYGDVGGQAERDRSIRESERLWKYSPVAQQIITTWTSFGVGESIEIKAIDPNAQEVWHEFSTDDRNKWLLSQPGYRSFSNWLLVTGNRFLAVYGSEADGESYVRRIKTSEIQEIVTHPDDDGIVLFYKRVWQDSSGGSRTWYYPDWWAFFYGGLDDEYKDGKTLAEFVLKTNDKRADKIKSNDETGTVVCIINAQYGEWDDGSHWGRPLLAPAGAPWLRAHKQFLESRLAVAKSKMLYARDVTTKGGSRAVDAVRRTLQSSLASSGYLETNPPPTPGSELVHSQAVTIKDLPMRTGAGDADLDHDQFSWIAGLSGGLFPYFLGLDSTRLATAKAMDKTQLMRFSEYRRLLSDSFKTLVRVVLLMRERFDVGTIKVELGTLFESYDAEVSVDSLVEADVESLTTSATQLVKDIVMPAYDAGLFSDESTTKVIAFLLRTILTGFGVGTVSEIVDDEELGLSVGEMLAVGLTTRQEQVTTSGSLSESHVGEPINVTCPICGHSGALHYPGHGPLLVCASDDCGQTFHPGLEFWRGYGSDETRESE